MAASRIPTIPPNLPLKREASLRNASLSNVLFRVAISRFTLFGRSFSPAAHGRFADSDNPSKPPFTFASLGFCCCASASRKRVRSACDAVDKGRGCVANPFTVLPCSGVRSLPPRMAALRIPTIPIRRSSPVCTPFRYCRTGRRSCRPPRRCASRAVCRRRDRHSARCGSAPERRTPARVGASRRT